MEILSSGGFEANKSEITKINFSFENMNYHTVVSEQKDRSGEHLGDPEIQVEQKTYYVTSSSFEQPQRQEIVETKILRYILS